jgi:hypothetical protein
MASPRLLQPGIQLIGTSRDELRELLAENVARRGICREGSVKALPRPPGNKAGLSHCRDEEQPGFCCLKLKFEQLRQHAQDASARIWSGQSDNGGGILLEVLDEQAITDMDLFDRVQLAETLRVCRASRSLSDAGRTLFSASRTRRSSANDADRLRKYLARFGLDWGSVAAG